MDIEIVCNTDDEAIRRNVLANSKGRKWQALIPPHMGRAILVGSGPSLKSTLDILKFRHSQGGVIFAMNNAANYLHSQGITPDYQVILDARPETVSLIGPARKHLFGSQVDPSLFERVPDAGLFQPAYEDIDGWLTELDYQDDFTLIGGGTTVGLTAMCLAYAMGYRSMHLFGYDSCHSDDDESHVIPQAINANEPWGTFEWQGKTYKGSLTMIRQAEVFQPICNNLIDMGCHITVDGSGLIFDIVNTQTRAFMSEKEKYQKMWEFEQYRTVAPGEHCIERFLDVAKPTAESRIIDFGCGTGRASVQLAKLGYKPLLVDFVVNSRDPEALDLPFVQADLKKLPDGIYSNYGFCTDVLEHIDTPEVGEVIESIMGHCRECFFQVSMVPDNCGQLIGQELHLTVKPFEWWLDRFFSLGLSLKHAKNDGNTATFYATR